MVTGFRRGRDSLSGLGVNAAFDVGLLDAGGRGDKVGKDQGLPAMGGRLQATQAALLSEEGMGSGHGSYHNCISLQQQLFLATPCHLPFAMKGFSMDGRVLRRR